MNIYFLQALAKAGKTEEQLDEYVLVEDVLQSWEKRDLDKVGSQRVLEAGERVMLAENRWKGMGKFILRKKSDVSISV